jgi:hypothetical protein
MGIGSSQPVRIRKLVVGRGFGWRILRRTTEYRIIMNKGCSDFGQFFFQQLLVIQVGVVAVQGEEFVVCAQFDDGAAM